MRRHRKHNTEEENKMVIDNNLDNLMTEDTVVVDSVMQVKHLNEALGGYNPDTPVVITFMDMEGNVSPFGINVVAVVDNARPDAPESSVVGLVIDITQQPFEIEAVYGHKGK
jgi:hypothetical protein